MKNQGLNSILGHIERYANLPFPELDIKVTHITKPKPLKNEENIRGLTRTEIEDKLNEHQRMFNYIQHVSGNLDRILNG